MKRKFVHARYTVRDDLEFAKIEVGTTLPEESHGTMKSPFEGVHMG